MSTKEEKFAVENVCLIGSRLLVRPNPPEEVTEGGLVIPLDARKIQNIGKVVTHGEGTEEEPMIIPIGSEVVYNPNGAVPVEVDGDKLVIIRQSDVLYYVKPQK